MRLNPLWSNWWQRAGPCRWSLMLISLIMSLWLISNNKHYSLHLDVLVCSGLLTSWYVMTRGIKTHQLIWGYLIEKVYLYVFLLPSVFAPSFPLFFSSLQGYYGQDFSYYLYFWPQWCHIFFLVTIRIDEQKLANLTKTLSNMEILFETFKIKLSYCKNKVLQETPVYLPVSFM